MQGVQDSGSYRLGAYRALTQQTEQPQELVKGTVAPA